MALLKRKKPAEKSESIDLGSEVEYKVGDKWLTGKVHAVRKTDKNGVVGYLVDNGKTHLEDEILTEGDLPNIQVSQPIQVDVLPENIRLKA